MQTTIFLSLVAYACATTFSPGPNNVLLLSNGARYGIKKCMPLVLGIWTGLITVMLITSFGCSLVGSLLPQIETVARIIGALYILWLGFKTLFKKQPSDKAAASGDDAAVEDVPLTYIHGFLLQFLNVKILMLGVAAYVSFILPSDASFLPTLIFAMTMSVCAACGNLIWLLAGRLILPFYSRHYRFFNLIMALLLFYCVYKILFV